jgi:hypothetical protein
MVAAISAAGRSFSLVIHFFHFTRKADRSAPISKWLSDQIAERDILSHPFNAPRGRRVARSRLAELWHTESERGRYRAMVQPKSAILVLFYDEAQRM